jgi:hypothetical protein
MSSVSPGAERNVICMKQFVQSKSSLVAGTPPAPGSIYYDLDFFLSTRVDTATPAESCIRFDPSLEGFCEHLLPRLSHSGLERAGKYVVSPTRLNFRQYLFLRISRFVPTRALLKQLAVGALVQEYTFALLFFYHFCRRGDAVWGQALAGVNNFGVLEPFERNYAALGSSSTLLLVLQA